MGSQAGDGYKSTKIFLVIMLDVSAVGISKPKACLRQKFTMKILIFSV